MLSLFRPGPHFSSLSSASTRLDMDRRLARRSPENRRFPDVVEPGENYGPNSTGSGLRHDIDGFLCLAWPQDGRTKEHCSLSSGELASTESTDHWLLLARDLGYTNLPVSVSCSEYLETSGLLRRLSASIDFRYNKAPQPHLVQSSHPLKNFEYITCIHLWLHQL